MKILHEEGGRYVKIDGSGNVTAVASSYGEAKSNNGSQKVLLKLFM